MKKAAKLLLDTAKLAVSFWAFGFWAGAGVWAAKKTCDAAEYCLMMKKLNNGRMVKP